MADPTLFDATYPINWQQTTVSPLLNDVPAPAQRHSPTSVAAAESIRPSAGSLRERVLAFLEEWGPATDEQICDALALNPSTCRPRRIELCRPPFCLIEQVGEATTRSGRRAALWGLAK